MRRILLLFSLLILAFPNHYIQSADREPDLMKAFDNSDAQFLEYSVHIQLDSPVEQKTLENLIFEKEEIKRQEIRMNGENNNIESLDIRLKEENSIVYYDLLKKRLERANIYGEHLISIIGVYEGEISEDQMKKIADKMIKEEDGSYIEGGFIRSSFLSVSAYSPSIPTYIVTGDNKINLNLALKYNPSENQTKLILATPLIYGDY